MCIVTLLAENAGSYQSQENEPTVIPLRKPTMSMSRPQPINVLMVAAASAALHAGAAALMAPILSFMFLCWTTPAAQIEHAAKPENAMVLAVLSPLISALFGFCAGALAGLGHNVFARSQTRVAIRLSEGHKVRTASFSNVA